MNYLYRVVYRLRREHWAKPEDKEWKVYCSDANPTGRPYKSASAVKGIVSSFANSYRNKYEWKSQRFPMTQEWEDM